MKVLKRNKQLRKEEDAGGGGGGERGPVEAVVGGLRKEFVSESRVSASRCGDLEKINFVYLILQFYPLD